MKKRLYRKNRTDSGVRRRPVSCRLNAAEQPLYAPIELCNVGWARTSESDLRWERMRERAGEPTRALVEHLEGCISILEAD